MPTLKLTLRGKDDQGEQVSLTFDQLILDQNQQRMVLGSKVQLAGPDWERSVTIENVHIDATM